MPRPVKLLIHFFLTAVLFTYWILVLVVLLNPRVPVTMRALFFMFLNLFFYYGPLWLIFIMVIFSMVQFFSERKYPIGFVHPPTPVYLFSFTAFVVTIVSYFNYDYYKGFFIHEAQVRFIRLLLLDSALVFLGILLVFFRGRKKRVVQALIFVVLLLNLALSYLYIAPRRASPDSPAKHPSLAGSARKLRIVVMDGLSLNDLLTMAADQKLLNFNWIRENGAVGRLTTFEPNYEFSLLNALLAGSNPSEYSRHSDFKFQFKDVGLEFDILPRYLFFRNSAKVGTATFYKNTIEKPLDRLKDFYEYNRLDTIQLIKPDSFPVFTEKSLAKNNTYIQLFADTLAKNDAKIQILKKAFYYDDFLNRRIPLAKTTNFKYMLIFFTGMEKIITYFSHFAKPDLFGNVDPPSVGKYGWILERYYQYYDSIVGKLIGSMGDDELLVILSFYEAEPLPLWRRILVNYVGKKDTFVYKPTRSQGVILMYEKSALKKQLFLDSVSIFDVFPTLAYYAGFPLLKELEGEVVRDIFTDEFLFNNPAVSFSD